MTILDFIFIKIRQQIWTVLQLVFSNNSVYIAKQHKKIAREKCMFVYSGWFAILLIDDRTENICMKVHFKIDPSESDVNTQCTTMRKFLNTILCSQGDNKRHKRSGFYGTNDTSSSPGEAAAFKWSDYCGMISFRASTTSRLVKLNIHTR